MSNEIRLIIADDHTAIRVGFAAELGKDPAFKVVRQASDDKEARNLIERLRPDVALLDTALRVPGDGFTLARAPQQKKLPVKIIFITAFHVSEAVLADLVWQAYQLPAEGFLLKSCATSEVIKGIKNVVAGERYFCRGVEHILHPDAPGPLDRLTIQQCRLILAVRAFKSNKEIAVEFHVRPKTVENRRQEICEELGLTGQGHNALLQFGIDHEQELRRKVALPAS